MKNNLRKNYELLWSEGNKDYFYYIENGKIVIGSKTNNCKNTNIKPRKLSLIDWELWKEEIHLSNIERMVLDRYEN